jgi:hypothetical protein
MGKAWKFEDNLNTDDHSTGACEKRLLRDQA